MTERASRMFRVEPLPTDPRSQSPEEEWMDSVQAICFDMAQKPTWRRRAELLKDAIRAVHTYFGKCAARK